MKQFNLRHLFAILFTLLLSSCQTTKNEFSGNWYTCDNKGGYFELIIRDHSFKYSTSYGLVTDWYKFNVSGDTLTYADPYLFKDSVITVKSKISFNNDGEMTQNFITSDETWVYHRINESIENIDDKEKLKSDTKKRAEQIACPDMRSTEEKQQDSLMKDIYFQF